MVSRKTLKIFFWSESFSIRTSEGRAPASELVLQRGSLPSEIALQRGSLESKMVYRGVGEPMFLVTDSAERAKSLYTRI